MKIFNWIAKYPIGLLVIFLSVYVLGVLYLDSDWILSLWGVGSVQSEEFKRLVDSPFSFIWDPFYLFHYSIWFMAAIFATTFVQLANKTSKTKVQKILPYFIPAAVFVAFLVLPILSGFLRTYSMVYGKQTFGNESTLMMSEDTLLKVKSAMRNPTVAFQQRHAAATIYFQQTGKIERYLDKKRKMVPYVPSGADFKARESSWWYDENGSIAWEIRRNGIMVNEVRLLILLLMTYLGYAIARERKREEEQPSEGASSPPQVPTAV